MLISERRKCIFAMGFPLCGFPHQRSPLPLRLPTAASTITTTDESESHGGVTESDSENVRERAKDGACGGGAGNLLPAAATVARRAVGYSAAVTDHHHHPMPCLCDETAGRICSSHPSTPLQSESMNNISASLSLGISQISGLTFSSVVDGFTIVNFRKFS